MIRIKKSKKSIWEGVREQLPALPSYCGGRGSCGKCRVKVVSGEASVSPADQRHLSKKEIEEGFRIACQSIPLSDCMVEVIAADGEEEMQILSAKAERTEEASETFSVAVDIGTTTLAFALLDAQGRLIAAETGLNHQRSLGADVVSRIELAIKGREAELTARIRKCIREGLDRLLGRQGIPLSKVNRIAAAGNTAMEQLFFGLPVNGLGSYPFSPYTEGFLYAEYGQLFPEPEGWERGAERLSVLGFPCIAGFVGGDITAGLYEMTSLINRKNAVLMDIGTNGELACISESGILTASTAAGPVFEGGSISCGMGSLPGAVCATRINGDSIECKTIGGKAPKGICGSGLIEAAADMLSLNVIDSGGCMQHSWQETGYLLARGKEGRRIVLTQADIREFQLAKAAIAAGVEILCKKAVRQPELYWLAGGLGNGLSVKKAIQTGLLLQGTQRLTYAAGNTSLKGAARLLKEGEAGMEKIKELLKRTEHIHLANTAEFEEAYIRHMNF